ncbi:2-methylaconitate cis-trans isomerase PrpF [Phyllobacterium endophyticum]|uniref:2-methylaconitate cis-trans isomerase PrpF n=1 Tax=Phyllobacterium endophyticum TaxID=1149773 RepID=UPI0011CADB33|nr:2-methylaconitate cis-trans isomerase PrpF [Phyllobacterium endophyticum]TXR47486.1 2-methylaconitate cis-trans isomerase PrpF [Phyllobacterium endophyticum]
MHRRIPAAFMRGGTSKGLFFKPEDLPVDPEVRDRVLLRVFGSPDPYGRQMDGMGGGYSSTSKTALISRSNRPDCDVDYLFGQVAVDRAFIDWSGGCDNLIGAVGPFAIEEGLVEAPVNGFSRVRIWQVNLAQRIIADVPMRGGQVEENGGFLLDGVIFPGAEIRIEYQQEAESPGLFPTGNVADRLQVVGMGTLEATLINAGMPTVIVDAATLGLAGTELPEALNSNSVLFERVESIRSAGAVAMGLSATLEEATRQRPHSPKLAFVSPSVDYITASGVNIEAGAIDLVARVVSMGKLHHAITGTGAIAIATALKVPGTVANRLAESRNETATLGHASGLLKVGVEISERNGKWLLGRIVMSRTARRLMEGWVRIPIEVWPSETG